VPQRQLYLLDIATKQLAAVPIPIPPNTLGFSRDGQYLAVGSYETGEISRINLAAGTVDLTVQAKTNLSDFFVPAKGDAFVVFYSHAAGPKPIEVRRWSDLKVAKSIPTQSLFPGAAGMHPGGLRLPSDGRLLVTEAYGKNGFGEGANLVVFEVKAR
jgi:hypothetical protein